MLACSSDAMMARQAHGPQRAISQVIETTDEDRRQTNGHTNRNNTSLYMEHFKKIPRDNKHIHSCITTRGIGFEQEQTKPPV